jgi:hypothetical protein
MSDVMEARSELDAAREQAKELVDRKRAKFGLALIRARESGKESQSTIGTKLGWRGTQQVRSYEQAYRDWLRDHPGETLD